MSVSTDKVALGTKTRIEYTLGEALEVVTGFAFGTASKASSYGTNNPYRYAYRSYDCALITSGSQVGEGDVFASVGLNSGITATVILRILAVLDNATSLPDLSAVPHLWELDPGRLNTDPGAGFPEHELWKWYGLLKGIHEVGGAVAAKVVHHKHPTVMPLWDSYIGKAYQKGKVWGDICIDLTSNDDWFAELERRFDRYRLTHQSGRGVVLRRLRLLDILVWSDVGGARKELAKLGRLLLATAGDPDRW